VPNDSYQSVEQFLKKLDAGELDRNLQPEMAKLTHNQRTEVAAILLEREAKRLAEPTMLRVFKAPSLTDES